MYLYRSCHLNILVVWFVISGYPEEEYNMKYIGIALVALLSVSMAFAYGGVGKQTVGHTTDCDVMTQVFADVDYASWVASMENRGVSGKVMRVVNQDNFPLFVEARQALIEQNYERAEQLRAELGLFGPHGMQRQQGRHR